MIDVFMRWYPENDLRRSFAQAVWSRLLRLEDICLQVVPGGPAVPRSESWYPQSGLVIPEPYHINSKKYAEKHAESEIYCVIDDDQLPLREDFFSYGAVVLANHPKYGMLSGFPLEYGLYGQPYAEAYRLGVMIVEAHSIGCPYFVRKGTLKHFPDSPLHMYDGDLSKVVTDQGLKTGLMPHALYNHLGYGFSQVEHAAR